VRVAARAGCANGDIEERRFTVEASKIPRIVGRGGSSMKALEAEHGVSIEIDNQGGVRVMGTGKHSATHPHIHNISHITHITHRI
jgi:polyribonucleotide nucleotidyltransferase